MVTLLDDTAKCEHMPHFSFEEEGKYRASVVRYVEENQRRESMPRYFIPFSGRDPAALDINGHRLLIVSSDQKDIEESLALFGADTVKSIDGDLGRDDGYVALEKLADAIKGDVVIAPEDEPLETILTDLHEELPWLQ